MAGFAMYLARSTELWKFEGRDLHMAQLLLLLAQICQQFADQSLFDIGELALFAQQYWRSLCMQCRKIQLSVKEARDSKKYHNRLLCPFCLGDSERKRDDAHRAMKQYLIWRAVYAISIVDRKSIGGMDQDAFDSLNKAHRIARRTKALADANPVHEPQNPENIVLLRIQNVPSRCDCTQAQQIDIDANQIMGLVLGLDPDMSDREANACARRVAIGQYPTINFL